jgi:hypothetical protein
MIIEIEYMIILKIRIVLLHNKLEHNQVIQSSKQKQMKIYMNKHNHKNKLKNKQ